MKGAGTDVIRVRGGNDGANYTIIPDQIETGTLMIDAAATSGDVVITGDHMGGVAKLLRWACAWRRRTTGSMCAPTACFAPSMSTPGYPGYPTDLQQPLGGF